MQLARDIELECFAIYFTNLTRNRVVLVEKMRGIMCILLAGVLFYQGSAKSSISDDDFQPIPKVLDGEHLSDPEDYPYFTRIYSSSYSEVHCVGILISPTKILSAAHCFFSRTNTSEEFIAILGCNAPFSAQLQDRGSCHIHRNLSPQIHPEYYATIYHNDIAIIDLSGPEPLFDATDKKIDLLGSWNTHTQSQPPGKVNCFALGWGCMDADDTESCGVQRVDLNLVGLMTRCASNPSYNETKIWSPYSQLCGLSSNGRLCNGDSGAGLFCPSGDKERFLLEGVLSSGDKVCDPSVPKVFTNLRPFKSWIGGTNVPDKATGNTFLTILSICTGVIILVVLVYWVVRSRNARSLRKIRNKSQSIPLQSMTD